MNLDLTNKNALICGGSRGIGKSTAMIMAGLGANITLISRNKTLLEEVLKLLDTSKGQYHDYIVANFHEPEVLREKAIDLAQKRTIHILVNNTGGPPPGSIRQASADQFEVAFRQHLICNHFLSEAIIPGMQGEGYGRIINIISTSVKQPIAGLGVSNTIRAAIANWSKTLALEVAPYGITVNNILPGATYTERLEEIIKSKAEKSGKPAEDVIKAMKSQIPMGRFGKPEEIGEAICFLASPSASYITGTNLVVDGGRTRCL